MTRREGDILHSYADISGARCVLGDEPAAGVAKGLRLTIDRLKKQRKDDACGLRS